MRYYREHPEEPINHDWLEGGKRETADLRSKLADSFYAKSEPRTCFCGQRLMPFAIRCPSREDCHVENVQKAAKGEPIGLSATLAALNERNAPSDPYGANEGHCPSCDSIAIEECHSTGETQYRFQCNDCGHVWQGNDFSEEEPEEIEPNYDDGLRDNGSFIGV